MEQKNRNIIRNNMYIFLDDLYDYISMISLMIPLYGLYLFSIGASSIIYPMVVLGFCYLTFYHAYGIIRDKIVQRKKESSRDFYYDVIQSLASKYFPNNFKAHKLKKDIWVDVAVNFIENYVGQKYNIKQKELTNNENNGNNKTSIYVAGSWVERDRMRGIMDRFRSYGYDITSDWPEYEQKHSEPYECSLISQLDFQNIKRADVLVAFMTDPEYPYRGTNTEIGYAIGSGKKVILVCDGIIEKNEADDRYVFSHSCMSNVFFWDKSIQHVTCFDDAIKVLNGEHVPSPYESFYSTIVPDHLEKYLSKDTNNENIMYVTDFM